MKQTKAGNLVISLDFELYWGVIDVETIDSFGGTILSGKETIPKLLALFEKYDIHATWGTVGMIFADNKKELIKYIPEIKPNYKNKELSTYSFFEKSSDSDESDCCYAPETISEILKCKNQEIGSHTFSHYYCRQDGETYESFDCDIKAAKKIAEDKFNIDIKSFIFPRNYFKREYVKSLKENNIIVFRGNQKHFAYDKNHQLSRTLRLIDTYIPVCGNKSYYKSECLNDGIVNLRASVFFRKYNKHLKLLEKLKMFNIKRLMKIAAKKGKIFHLWWHPHNMGENPEIFLSQLTELFEFYKKLNTKYNFTSKNMCEIAEDIIKECL